MVELTIVADNKANLRLKIRKMTKLFALKDLIYLSEPGNIAEL